MIVALPPRKNIVTSVPNQGIVANVTSQDIIARSTLDEVVDHPIGRIGRVMGALDNQVTIII
ncbi:hypothetical protein IE00_01735 [Paracoccus sp. SM22M-07]|nr:hypothetical protein IE00_01735 [Paracoccus sp. SM22M-07]